MDVLTPEQRRRCMQSNKGKGTKPEIAFGRLMWSAGIRYRKHPKGVPGTPDFCIRKYRMAIFVDGEFWHGRDWPRKKPTIKNNRDFWIAKIERNIARDISVNEQLTSEGWKVFRFWESDIKRNPGNCIRVILEYLAGFSSASSPDYIPMDYQDCQPLFIPVAINCVTNSIAAEPRTAYISKDKDIATDSGYDNHESIAAKG